MACAGGGTGKPFHVGGRESQGGRKDRIRKEWPTRYDAWEIDKVRNREKGEGPRALD